MGRVSSAVKYEILERLQAEDADPQLIADEAGIGLATVLRWRQEQGNEPLGVAPPPLAGAKTKRGGAKRGARPVTEETAGQLCAGIFAMVAMADGPWWFLSVEERTALAGPAADSLRSLPNPVADAINQYSAPVVFGTTLSTIITHKLRLRNAQMAAGRRGLHVVPPKPPGAPQAPQAPQRPPTAATADGGIPPVTDVDMTVDLAEALDSARGALADEVDVGDMTFQ